MAKREPYDNQPEPKGKICDFCKGHKNPNTGKKIISKDRLTYKWKCKDCLESR